MAKGASVLIIWARTASGRSAWQLVQTQMLYPTSTEVIAASISGDDA
jgi:hypothetical protein